MVRRRRYLSLSIPPLQLPPHGISRLVATSSFDIVSDQSGSHSKCLMNHPRHRLGVASLALDTSTQLVGRAAFEGILYSDGKDGLVISWDKTESDVWPVDESRVGWMRDYDRMWERSLR